MADSLTEVTPLTEREQVDRKAAGIEVERGLIFSFEGLLNGLAAEDEEVESDKELIVDKMEKFTDEWLTPPGSGTNGEIVTRWVGLGLLADFPTFRDWARDDNIEVNIEQQEDGKTMVNVGVAFGPIEERQFVGYQFRV